MNVARVALSAVGGMALAAAGLDSLHRAPGIEPPRSVAPNARSAWKAGARTGDAASTLLAAAPLALLGAGAVSKSPLLLAAGLAGTATAALGFALLAG